jgi:diguanylate cyclase (GGDEF)-like protein
MNNRHRIKENDSGDKLPLEMYRSVVESLYADQVAIFVGAFSTLFAASILYFRTGQLIHLGFSLIICLVGIKRVWDVRVFRAGWSDIKRNRGKLKRWENLYLFWGSLNVACLGFWSFYVSIYSSDDFALLMTISLTLANLIGISGRNFASERVVNSQLFCVAVPLVTGSFLAGDFYKTLLGIFLVPFFVGIKIMSDKLRGILHNSTIAAYNNELIAGRFDAALNNISHGIAMINDFQQFVVVNDKFSDLAGVGDQNLFERNIVEIEGGEITQYGEAKAGKNLFVEIERCLTDGQTRRYSYILEDKRIIEFNYYPMKDGGVILLEDVSLRVASEVEISILAKYDPLTHLPNRRFFMEEVHRLFIVNDKLQPCSLYFVDLDKFKVINDSLGHSTGDKLLNTISIRLKSILIPGSQICRFGGDEFVILVPDLVDRDQTIIRIKIIRCHTGQSKGQKRQYRKKVCCR